MVKTELKEKAFSLIDQLPTGKLQTAIDFLAYLQDKESWEATFELTSNPEIMSSLAKSEDDVKHGRVRKWKDIKRKEHHET